MIVVVNIISTPPPLDRSIPPPHHPSTPPPLYPFPTTVTLTHISHPLGQSFLVVLSTFMISQLTTFVDFPLDAWRGNGQNQGQGQGQGQGDGYGQNYGQDGTDSAAAGAGEGADAGAGGTDFVGFLITALGRSGLSGVILTVNMAQLLPSIIAQKV